jgi:hypothetical protein
VPPRVRASLDQVDDPQQKHRAVPELEHVAELDRGRHVRDAEIVAIERL